MGAGLDLDQGLDGAEGPSREGEWEDCEGHGSVVVEECSGGEERVECEEDERECVRECEGEGGDDDKGWVFGAEGPGESITVASFCNDKVDCTGEGCRSEGCGEGGRESARGLGMDGLDSSNEMSAASSSVDSEGQVGAELDLSGWCESSFDRSRVGFSKTCAPSSISLVSSSPPLSRGNLCAESEVSWGICVHSTPSEVTSFPSCAITPSPGLRGVDISGYTCTSPSKLDRAPALSSRHLVFRSMVHFNFKAPVYRRIPLVNCFNVIKARLVNKFWQSPKQRVYHSFLILFGKQVDRRFSLKDELQTRWSEPLTSMANMSGV
jgi:hypothetical protein